MHMLSIFHRGVNRQLTVRPSMLVLNEGFARWCRCEISPSWAWQYMLNKRSLSLTINSAVKNCSAESPRLKLILTIKRLCCDIMLLFHRVSFRALAIIYTCSDYKLSSKQYWKGKGLEWKLSWIQLVCSIFKIEKIFPMPI